MSQQVIVASNATLLLSLKPRPDALAPYMLQKPSKLRKTQGEHRSFRDGDYNGFEDTRIPFVLYTFVPCAAARGEP
eukprot:scaffold335063_cov21-Prasinocladus_malaysianus.AAC.1